MQEILGSKTKKPGLDPGTLVHVGARRAEKTTITILDYDEHRYEEKEAQTVEECFAFKGRPTVTWINIGGVHQVDIIEKIGNHFGVHPLLLEDILHTAQRPKLEDFYNYLYIVLKLLRRNEANDEIDVEQMSLVLGDNFVITFQETSGDIFEVVRDRVRNNKGRTRKMGADYLAYSLIDTIVDNYFISLEQLGEDIEDLEEELVMDPTKGTLQKIHAAKRDMLTIRRSVWPLREVISGLQRGESTLFKKGTLVYLRDVYDHTIQVIDTVEAFRDMVSGMMDIYLSGISNKLNEVMKVLTIISTIFMPLTFVTGVYGMNFAFMPPKDQSWGFYASLSVMAAVVGAMLVFFRRKKWI